MKKATWVVEWSQQQNCFHLGKLEDVIANNMKLMLQNKPNEFAIVAFAKSYFDANVMATHFASKQRKLSHELFQAG